MHGRGESGVDDNSPAPTTPGSFFLSSARRKRRFLTAGSFKLSSLKFLDAADFHVLTRVASGSGRVPSRGKHLEYDPTTCEAARSRCCRWIS